MISAEFAKSRASTGIISNISKKYLWNGNQTLSITTINPANSATHYYLQDGKSRASTGITSVTQLVDSAGTITANYDYTPFGSLISNDGTGNPASSPTTLNPFKFSNEYHDQETNLIYYNYRYYNPTLGCWTKRDDIAEKGGLNLY